MTAQVEPHRGVAKADGPRSKRSVILDAAIDYFGEDGFEHTKWAAIADDVGIGQTALYHYFESKAHCLLTIMSIELQRSLDRFHNVTDGTADAAQALRDAVEGAYVVTPREVLQMRILQSHMDLLGTPRKSQREEAERQNARALVRKIEESWTALVERGMSAGTFPRRDPRQTARALLALVVSVWRWYRPAGPTSLEEVRDFISAACLRLVTN